MIVSLRNGKIAGANPWRALTLEWATTSPPPVTNFVGDPVPFPDPYGYGTEGAVDYLDAIDREFGMTEDPAEARKVGPSATAGAPGSD
jgi:heme/copper-type cytochrome/quinol oxidase subunit 1